jgi:hypothetical protein
MLSKSKKPYLIIILLITLAVSPAFALGEGNRNLLLIGVMCFTPFIIISYGSSVRINGWLALFIVSIIIFPLIHQPQSIRWSSILYTILFCLTFIAYKSMLHKNHLTPIAYLKILKYLILAYFFVLLIQQICVLFDLPVFNISRYIPNEPWKLNSLAAEPSHSARIVALLMYSYIIINELILNRTYNLNKDFKNDKWVWLAFFWTMTTMNSGTAFLFLAIIFFKFIRLKNLKQIFIFAVGAIIILNFIDSTSYERSYKTLIATLTLDQATILEADHSASIRILPFLILVKMVSLNSLDGWFGHGVDHVSTFLSDFIPGVNEGLSGGGFFQIWMEYGFISMTMYFIFSFSNTYRKGDYISILFWFLLVFLYGVNSQIVWLCIILLFTNKYFITRGRKLFC